MRIEWGDVWRQKFWKNPEWLISGGIWVLHTWQLPFLPPFLIVFLPVCFSFLLFNLPLYNIQQWSMRMDLLLTGGKPAPLLLTWTFPAWPLSSWCWCLRWPLEGQLSATVKYQGETNEATIDSSSWMPSPCEGILLEMWGLFERIYSRGKCQWQLCTAHPS